MITIQINDNNTIQQLMNEQYKLMITIQINDNNTN